MAIIERHHVVAGVIWLDQAPVRSVEHVRCDADPEGVSITLRPGRDYSIVDAAVGHIYVAALVGKMVEIAYTAYTSPHGEYGRDTVQYPHEASERTR